MTLFWNKNFDLHVESFFHNHIDALIDKGKENAWRFSGFYRAPETYLKIESLDLLRDLQKRFLLPWLRASDFSKLLKSNEKLGGHLRPYGQMQKFWEALDECGLMDLGFVGNKFTWFKNYPNGEAV